MKAAGKYILFRPFERNNISEGGLFIPDTVKKVSNKGEIVSIGDKVTKVKEGDIAFRVKDWGEEILIEGEKHFLMTQDSIIAVQ